jgi:hypothetical protein
VSCVGITYVGTLRDMHECGRPIGAAPSEVEHEVNLNLKCGPTRCGTALAPPEHPRAVRELPSGVYLRAVFVVCLLPACLPVPPLAAPCKTKEAATPGGEVMSPQQCCSNQTMEVSPGSPCKWLW